MYCSIVYFTTQDETDNEYISYKKTDSKKSEVLVSKVFPGVGLRNIFSRAYLIDCKHSKCFT